MILVAMDRDFEELVAKAVSAPIDGWDFSWLDDRATEERPSWGYQRLMSRRLPSVTAALDIQTGDGEVLAGVRRFPPTMVATESWPPNLARATARLHPLGVVVVAVPDEPPLPFADAAFELVVSRHPVTVWWAEIARVLTPGGTYFAQHVGPSSGLDLIEFFLGPQAPAPHRRDPAREAEDASAAGLEVLDVRAERLRMEFYDVGAVIYFLRKVTWIVPGFNTQRYHGRLRALHEQIKSDGAFVAHSTRTLIEARRPT